MGVIHRGVGHLHLLRLLLLHLCLVGMLQGLLLLLLLLLPRLVLPPLPSLELVLLMRLLLLLCLFSLPLLLLPSSLVLVPALPPLPSLRLATQTLLSNLVPILTLLFLKQALPFNLLPYSLMPLVQSLVMVDFPLKILSLLVVVAMHFLQGQRAKRQAQSMRIEMGLANLLWGMGMGSANLWGTGLEGAVVVWPEEGCEGRLEGEKAFDLFWGGSYVSK